MSSTANQPQCTGVLVQLGKIDGFALIAIAVMLFGLQITVYMTPKQVANASPAVSSSNIAHERYPVPGILGAASLMAGLSVLAARRRAGGLRAKTTVP